MADMEDTKDTVKRTVKGRNGGTLHPWGPGESGNARGMAPGTKHYSTLIRQAGKHKLSDGTTLEKFFANSLWVNGSKGNGGAIKALMVILGLDRQEDQGAADVALAKLDTMIELMREDAKRAQSEP
jgi:hypothetical protein